VVCDRNRREKVEGILRSHEFFFNLVAYGKGTANSKVLSYLGLGETEKTVFFSIMPDGEARKAIDAVDSALQLEKPGHGIVFLMKLHHGCYHRPVEFAGETVGGMTMQQETAQAHNLILVVLNRGYSEEVMDVARAAGAKGGTVLHARGFGAAGMEKFFGVTISPEKELLMILARKDASCAIMSDIAEKAGPGTDACAISFSLPVEAVKGLRTAAQG
jgi:nitrogen regulatory protein PII